MHRSPQQSRNAARRRTVPLLMTTRGPDASRRRARSAMGRMSALASVPTLAIAAVAATMVGGVTGGDGGSAGPGAQAHDVATVPVVDANTVFTLNGHGHGHGRGMGQWGAFGYAVDDGWSAEQIINHYYGGTELQNIDTGPISVRLTEFDGKDLAVTSDAPMTVGGHEVPAGKAVVLHPTAGGAEVTVTDGCGGAPTDTYTVGEPRVTPAGGALSICGAGSYRGDLGVALDKSGEARAVNYVGMEDYLRGVVPKEISAGWADKGAEEALRAQAIAARSYAAAEGRYAYADTCDTQACQVYGGMAEEDPRTDAAVADTAGMVVTKGGAPVATEFSASTGGWTAGGDFPAVEDAGDVVSPTHDWITTVTAKQVSDAFGVGPLKEMTVAERNGLGADGGRVLTLHVVGEDKTVDVSGDDARTGLGLKSDWFTIEGQGAVGSLPPESSGSLPGLAPPAPAPSADTQAPPTPPAAVPEPDEETEDQSGDPGLTADEVRSATDAVTGAMTDDPELRSTVDALGGAAARGLAAYNEAQGAEGQGAEGQGAEQGAAAPDAAEPGGAAAPQPGA